MGFHKNLKVYAKLQWFDLKFQVYDCPMEVQLEADARWRSALSSSSASKQTSLT